MSAVITGSPAPAANISRPSRMSAEQSQQAGWAAFDAGWARRGQGALPAQPGRRTRGRRRRARGQRPRCPRLPATHARQARPRGSEQSVHIADLDGVDPGVRALLDSHAAWTFALDGDAETIAACLGRAEDALAAANANTPDYAAWIDENELTIMTGRCWNELNGPLRAVPAWGEHSAATATLTPATRRYSSWLTDSYIDAGEIEQAVDVVRLSLMVMGDVASVRPRRQLSAVASRLAEHRALPAVADHLRSDALHPLAVRR